jgi:hypothetical protein
MAVGGTTRGFMHRAVELRANLTAYDACYVALAEGLDCALCTGPMRNERYREFVAPQGYDDELRAVFRTGDKTWGMTSCYRQRGRSAFSADDVALLSAVSTPVGSALQTQAAAGITPWPTSANAPGLLFIDADDVLISANAEAAHRLGEAYGPPPGNGWVEVLADRSGDDLRLPFPTVPLLVRARAVAAGHGRGPARLRLRDARGRWLVLHASCMPGTLVRGRGRPRLRRGLRQVVVAYGASTDSSRPHRRP